MAIATETVKMVRPEDLPKASYCTAVPPDEFPQFTRGMLRWLREQARQAEEDPNRGWEGAKPEYIKLFTRTHPDPHPEKIIYGPKATSYDPYQLPDVRTEILIVDNFAGLNVSSDRQAERFGYPVMSQQLLAALCGQKLQQMLQPDLYTKLNRASSPEEAKRIRWGETTN